MNKKSIAALSVAATIALGVGASSYAWFTSTASSQTNTFKAGTLGVASSIANPDKTVSLDLKLDNMECGTSEKFVYIVNNMKGSNPSSLDLNFENVVEGNDDTATQYDSLLEVAKFDIDVTGSESTKLANGAELSSLNSNDLSYSNLVGKLSDPIKLVGGAENSVTYTIKVKLPDILTTDGINDNEYQGKSGSIKITANAKQITEKSDYEEPVNPAEPVEPVEPTSSVVVNNIKLDVKKSFDGLPAVMNGNINYYKNSSGLKVIEIGNLINSIYDIDFRNVVLTQKESNLTEYILTCTGIWDKVEFKITIDEVEKSFTFTDVGNCNNYIKGSGIDKVNGGNEFLGWLSN